MYLHFLKTKIIMIIKVKMKLSLSIKKWPLWILKSIKFLRNNIYILLFTNSRLI